MADYGLEIYNDSGQMTLGVSDRLVRLLGEISVNNNGSHKNAAIRTGTPFYILISQKDYPSNDGGYEVWFDGDYIKWTVSKRYGNVKILYGVY